MSGTSQIGQRFECEKGGKFQFCPGFLGVARGLHGGCRAKIHCFLKLGKKCFWPTSAKRGNRGVPSPLQGIICPLGGQGRLGDPPPIKGILCPLSVK